MYKKIIHTVINEYPYGQMIVYKSETGYFLVDVDLTGEEVYWFIDSKLERIYPANTYLKLIGFFGKVEDLGDEFNFSTNIDLNTLGSSPCPNWRRKILDGSSNFG